MKIWPIVITTGVALALTAGTFIYRANRLPEVAPVDRAMRGAEVVVDRLSEASIPIGRPPKKESYLFFQKIYVVKKDLKEVVDAIDKEIKGTKWKKEAGVPGMEMGSDPSRLFYVGVYSYMRRSKSGVEIGTMNASPGRQQKEYGIGRELADDVEKQYSTVTINISYIEPDLIDRVTGIFRSK